MGVNLQEFLNDKVIGNIRSGTRNENGTPKKLEHFDVHTDKSTSEVAVEIFKQKFEEPNKLQIRFIKQNPIDLHLERYEGRKRRCIGDNKKAEFIDDNGKKIIIECNAKECKYKKDKLCKYKARLYFLIKGLENEGVWCYPIGSQSGIKNICSRIARANRLNEDLTQNWYELYLEAEDAPVKGQNYIPDIRKLGEINNKNNEKQPSEPKENNNINKLNEPKQQIKNYLKIIEFQKTKYENIEVPKIIFVDTNSKKQELILTSKSKQEILKVKPGSIILPLSISKRGEFTILNDYNIVKVILENKENIENKKAV